MPVVSSMPYIRDARTPWVGHNDLSTASTRSAACLESTRWLRGRGVTSLKKTANRLEEPTKEFLSMATPEEPKIKAATDGPASQ